ncbi:MAG TPA: ADOP family duplicated permease [Terriglobales bacterium]
MRGLLRRVGGWLRWRKTQRELTEELAAHRSLKQDELAAAGVSGERLAAATERAMGNELAMREAARGVWLWPWLEALGQGLRQGARRLRRSPGFTLAAVLTLALGIGANTAIFSVVEAVMLRPLPYPAPEQLVEFAITQSGAPVTSFGMPAFEFLRSRLQSVSALAAIRGMGTVEVRHGSQVAWLKGMLVTSDVFRVLGVAPRQGRDFNGSDEQAGGAGALILTDAVWRHDFGGAPVVGQAVSLNGSLYTVAGVLPPGFVFQQDVTDNPGMFVAMRPGSGLSDTGLNSEIIGRLRPGVTSAQSGAEMATLATAMRSRGLLPNWATGVSVQNYQELMTGPVRTGLWFLLAAVALLLLIACANVAGLLLARTLARQPELALRRALGAGSGRLFVQFFTEGLLLALLGGAAALGLAAATLQALAGQLPWDVPLGGPIGLDGRVLGYTLLVALGASLAFAVAAARQGAARPLRVGRFRRRGLGRDVLVVAQVALSLLLLAGAGLLVRSLVWLESRPLGFDPAGRMVFSTQLPSGAAPNAAAAWRFDQQVLEQLRRLPGVRAAAVVSMPPLEGQGNLPGEAAGRPETGTAVEYRAASPGYCDTLGIALLQGRALSERDTAGAPLVTVVSQSLAQAWFGGHALGQQVRIGVIGNQSWVPAAMAQPRTIVGVVADVRTQRVDKPMRLTMYVPAAQDAMGAGWFVLRGQGETEAQIRRAVAVVNPEARVSDVAAMDTVVAHTLARPIFEARLSGGFAVLALALTAVGLYALLAYAVTERRQEIGIRMALGATRGAVLRQVVARGLLLAAAGVVAGVAAALPLARLLASLLAGVQPGDPATLAAAAGLLLLVAAAACLLPAWRATQVDTAGALRTE